ncbi:Planctomycete cytochrome C [Symmachiella dynata]|uniref:DUF1553 domain-containing protein n=1 Tax=Symmachiella dynata TaxID=2527995 RepID=UPI00118B8012|nr:DUF1553 domain-containing protein [Symmachiella dynata]QDT49196.1 Planctomycete cytochrome C [Symmachiella dynata]
MFVKASGINKITLWAILALALVATPAVRASDGPVDYNRDILPMFAAKCYACHGPDEEHREADLRFDDRKATLELGAIVPGKPDESELIARIESDDPDLRMPPPQSNDTLSDEQKELFRRWISQGAEYDEHWAFVPPKRPPVPSVEDARWPRNPIDNFVLARLEAEGLSPTRKADRYALVRRVYLDLIGLPPTPEEADAFATNEDPAAYEKLVDQLLESPHYGERWARDWLDLARYADTNGYEKDRDRSVWPYRDWVIRALNADMPFDQFTIEQLAGDMLPGARTDQIIATGFHRNTMLNEEGGIDPLEYRFYAMVDRVATTGTVWLGLTTGCAQCHTHKYDPITHTDYYRFMALLDNADEPDLILKTPDVQQCREELELQIAELEAELPNQFPITGEEKPDEDPKAEPKAEPEAKPDARPDAKPEPESDAEPEAEPDEKPKAKPDVELSRQRFKVKFEEWLQKAQSEAVNWTVLRPVQFKSNLPKLERLDDHSILSSGDITKRDVFHLTFQIDEAALPVTALRLEVLPDDRLPAGGPGRAYYEGRKGDFFLSELSAKFGGAALEFVAASQSYGKLAFASNVDSVNANAENVHDGDGSTGWSTSQREGEPHQLVLNLSQPITQAGELQVEMLFERHYAASLGRFRFSTGAADTHITAKQMPVEMEKHLTAGADQWSDEDLARIKRHYSLSAPELAEARKPIDELREKLPTYPTTLVMQERPHDNPRPTHRHHRGEFLSPKEAVTPGIPDFLLTSTDGKNGPSDRLSLARWLVSRDNPLIGRVTVNRAWQAFFGTGLVKTSSDFGTQGDPPTHPELLDWLATEFVEQGWSLKKLHRLIVTSATYRQRSQFTPELLERDPHNALLARGPRQRVNAETVRDIMLRISGLLSPKLYGRSVYPPQPDSVSALAYGGASWPVSTGEDRYRRSLYTFSKRTAPFAAFTVFDAPTGETCIARRNRSNTPLQALTLLNDEMYLEMSRALAKRIMDRASSPKVRAGLLLRQLLTRPVEVEEIDAVVKYQRAQLARLENGELNAAEIAGNEEATPQQAAWAMAARALMNLDEVITKP